MAYSVGDTVTLDGIESLIVYDAGSEQSWGRYLCVDKNHDLNYYIKGDDYYPGNGVYSDPSNSPYVEWGGYGVVTGITSADIGMGLSNTNSLIGMNLHPSSPEYPVIWEWVTTFRSTYSDNWFVPSANELAQAQLHKDLLEKNKN